MYIDTLSCLRSTVRRKCTGKRRTNRWVLLHDNAPAHRSVFGQGFLSKEQCENTGASPILS